MKSCPHCGKSISDDAAKCIYCGQAISMNQPQSGVTATALTCPACGASLEYDGVSPTVHCTFCGNNVIVSSQAVLQGQAQSTDEAFAEQVRMLIELGETDQAIELLGQQLSIQPVDARQVVALFEAGNYGSEAQIIKDALRRKGGPTQR